MSKYYNSGNGIDLCFDFDIGDSIVNALNAKPNPDGTFGSSATDSAGKSLRQVIVDNINKKRMHSTPLSFYSPFLRNHDQERIMYAFDNNITKMKMAATILMTYIGTPFIYYGEEIGMTQNTSGDDIFKRAPMQWNSDTNAGFSSSASVWVDDGKWVPWRSGHQAWWQQFLKDSNANNLNVASQLNNPDSLLNFYRTLIAIRKNNPEFSSVDNDSIEILETENTILAFKRKHLNQESLIIMNCSDSMEVSGIVPGIEGKSFKDLLTLNPYTFKSSMVTLQAGEFLILKLPSE
jgi:glycosidase